jgi:hypothetical protein
LCVYTTQGSPGGDPTPGLIAEPLQSRRARTDQALYRHKVMSGVSFGIERLRPLTPKGGLHNVRVARGDSPCKQVPYCFPITKITRYWLSALVLSGTSMACVVGRGSSFGRVGKGVCGKGGPGMGLREHTTERARGVAPRAGRSTQESNHTDHLLRFTWREHRRDPLGRMPARIRGDGRRIA